MLLKLSCFKLKGFSLIEMAIVLIIAGLIAGMTLPALRGIIDVQKGRVTASHQEQILYAMASFANQNRSLPYAADPLKNGGKEDKDAKRRRGIVPFASLGLPESVAKDGYRRWFTYVVDGHYAVVPKFGIQGSFTQPLENRLCGKDNHQNPLKVRGKGAEVTIAFAVISHGPEGRGACPNPMSSPPLGADEHVNATSDHEVIDRSISLDPANPFSHSISWVTARNLLAIYGHNPCPPEKELIPSSLPLQFSQDPPKTGGEFESKK